MSKTKIDKKAKVTVTVNLEAVLDCLSDEQIAAYEAELAQPKLKKILADQEVMRTALCFIDNGLNVSAAARAIYMHRNTMMYRLNKIKRVIGIDVRTFDGAVSLKILEYMNKKLQKD